MNTRQTIIEFARELSPLRDASFELTAKVEVGRMRQFEEEEQLSPREFASLSARDVTSPI